jgi:hypothetical protein
MHEAVHTPGKGGDEGREGEALSASSDTANKAPLTESNGHTRSDRDRPPAILRPNPDRTWLPRLALFGRRSVDLPLMLAPGVQNLIASCLTAKGEVGKVLS